MENQRQQRRQRALKSGRIIFNKRSSTMDCVVRNLSEEGALLSVEGMQGIPDQFELEIDGGAVKRTCQVVWRQERRLGVRFA